MNNTPLLKTVSEQSTKIYKLLLENESLTAYEIADELGILPNAVYRTANKMVKIGMIERIDNYPIKYKARNPKTAMNWYLLTAAQNFRKDFDIKKKRNKKADNAPSLSFVKDRSHLIAKELEDLRHTRKTYNYIVSGHNVPDEVFLETRKAIIRGVKIRKIIHQKSQLKNPYVRELQDIGVEVRFLPGVDIRMFVFDSQIVYLTSYSADYNYKAFGVRFAYMPVAMQMDELFEQNWQKAKKI